VVVVVSTLCCQVTLEVVVGPPNSVAVLLNEHRSIVHGHQFEDDVFPTGDVGDCPAEGFDGVASGAGLDGAAKLHPQDVGDGLGGVEGGKPERKCK